MADDTEIVVGSLISMHLRVCEFVTEKETKTGRVVKKYIRERGQYGECHTTAGACC